MNEKYDDTIIKAAIIRALNVFLNNKTSRQNGLSKEHVHYITTVLWNTNVFVIINFYDTVTCKRSFPF